jgi:TonB family protein
MKALNALLIAAFLITTFQAQSQPARDQEIFTSRKFLEQLLKDNVYNFVSAKMAESLLLHRVEPIPPHGPMMAKVSGTVVVAFEINKQGIVTHATVVSGPKLFQAPVLAAVRQWRFKPYTLVDRPITVATSIPIPLSNYSENLGALAPNRLEDT